MIASVADGLGFWVWIILGLVLFAAEAVAPGIFLIWFGLAAILTGLADAWFGLSWQAAFLVFAGLSVAAVLVGRAVTGGARQVSREDGLNRRGQDFVGRVFVLDAAIAHGEGRVRVGDSSWRLTGPDAPAGASVRVVRVEGGTLVVERA
ncbi:MAG TPA: NfeD family protein [Microvirga sp.]|nr:NfeD family protein [Microvirga sp.]